jgi:hypothetical protein
MWITLQNVNDKKYYHYYDGMVAVTDTLHYDKSIFIPTKITSSNDAPTQVDVAIEVPKPHLIEINVMNPSEFCIDRLTKISSQNDDHLLVFSDVFYNGAYKSRTYFLNAHYICNNQIDYYYFTRYLKLRASYRTNEIISQSTVLINPHPDYDKEKFKNAIYTTFLTHMAPNFLDAICRDDRTLRVFILEPSDNNSRIISEDFVNMSDEYVYIPNPKLRQNDTFRIIFGHLMLKGKISITDDLYYFVAKHIKKANLFFNIEINREGSERDTQTYTIDSDIVLYKWQ